MKAEYEKHDWPKPQDREIIIEDMKEYYGFALEKATDHRGLSAGRSIEKMEAWVWLLDDGNYEKIHWSWYTNYGAPILKEIGDIYGFEYLGKEEGEYADYIKESNQKFLNMANGKPCRPDCNEGCG
jgi:hypothetical protein